MSDVAARLSLIFAVHEHTSGEFPHVRTYPASYERRVAGPTVKVFAAAGTVPAGSAGASHNVAGTLTKVRYWLVENTAAPEGSEAANVAVAGGPVNGTVPRGQVMFATNEAEGWTAGTVTVTGTAGTPYKVIAIGD